MGNPILIYEPIRGTGGHITVHSTQGVITRWTLNQRREHADITTTGSGKLRARLSILQDFDFLVETVWDVLQLPHNVWKILMGDFDSDGGILGPIQFDVGEAGGGYLCESFVLDNCQVINAAADVVRVQITGSQSAHPITVA